MKHRPFICNYLLLAPFLIFPSVLFAQHIKKKAHYIDGSVYAGTVLTTASLHDTTTSGKKIGTETDIKINRVTKEYTISFKDENHKPTAMVFTFIRNIITDSTQPADKTYLAEYQNKYYFLSDDIDNPLIKALIIRSEKTISASTSFQYRFTGLKAVK